MRTRNPFLLLASEHIGFESTFLGLLDPGILDIFQGQADSLWNRIHIIRSSPGGGKTTLLRLFTPMSLKYIHDSRQRQDYKEVYEKLKTLDVLDEDGVHTLGVMLSCSGIWNYADIEDLDVSETRRKRLLFSLLNSRIIISALKGMAVLLNLPLKELDSLYIKMPPEGVVSCYPTECRATILFEWAQSVEERILSTIDDMELRETDNGFTDGTLSSLYVINPRNMLYRNSTIVDHVIVMLDDFHQLLPTQRKDIIDTLGSFRPPVGFWISERLEALNVDQVIAEIPRNEVELDKGLEEYYEEPLETTDQPLGDQIRRDFEIKELGAYWSENRAKFRQMILSIADKRILYADPRDISLFGDCLADEIEEANWSAILPSLFEYIVKKISGKKKFEEWLNIVENSSYSDHEKAIMLKTIGILAEREKQTTLDEFGASRGDIGTQEDIKENFNKRLRTDIKTSARLFLSKDFNLPYYFGLSCLVDLSSFNVEQFIHLCSYLFEEYISLSLISEYRKPLTPESQEKKLKKGIEEILKYKLEKIPEGEMIANFIDSIGRYSNYETYRPNAPYSPGVTGIGITMKEVKFLIHHERKNDLIYRKYKDLLATILECIKKNLLIPRPDYRCKERQWMVLYLNRILCVRYNLPLQYGGWREKSLNELNAWIHEKANGGTRL